VSKIQALQADRRHQVGDFQTQWPQKKTADWRQLRRSRASMSPYPQAHGSVLALPIRGGSGPAWGVAVVSSQAWFVLLARVIWLLGLRPYQEASGSGPGQRASPPGEATITPSAASLADSKAGESREA